MYQPLTFTTQDALACIEECRRVVPVGYGSVRDPAAYAACLDGCSGLPPTGGDPFPQLNWIDDLLLRSGQGIQYVVQGAQATLGPPLLLVVVGLVALALITRRL